MDKIVETLMSYGLPVLRSLSSKRKAIVLNSLSPRERQTLSILVSRNYWETNIEGDFIVVRETE